MPAVPVVLLLLLACLPTIASAAPKVVATILPVHSLVAAVMQGAGPVQLLLPPTVSPHGHALRPEQARMLDQAELVFRVGPALESFLDRPLAALAGDAEVVSLMETPGMHLLPYRDVLSGDPAHDHGHDHDHDHGHGHDGEHGSGDVDPHVWMSLANARRIVAVAAERLARHDPEQAALYRDNATRLAASLDALQAELHARLAPVAERGFLVFHDAYRYFEEEMGLKHLGAVVLNPSLSPGVARMRSLREALADGDAYCLFVEPQFPEQVARTAVEGSAARLAVVDPLGVGLTPGPAAYEALVRQFADQVVTCLSGPT